MIQTGFESRVKIQQIIDSQLPEFILDENPKASEFLKQYYISQEYQGGPIDISDNLDQYLKIDNLIPEVVVGSTKLTTGISSTASTIQVSSTKGFPQSYGLFKIDDEIITYTGITTNTFTGCVRGFSGITTYNAGITTANTTNYVGDLIFKTSQASAHSANNTVTNLSSLFLKEFYKKLKYSFTPGLENLDFVPDLNVGNFIKESRTLYQAKGTEESFRILFNVLFGETPKVINLENSLLKPSSANYVRRLVIVAERISGNPLLLSGQTIKKTTDDSTTASVSEVEIIRRGQKVYYKLFLFVGYDDASPTITGTFGITASTKVIETVPVEGEVITVDSTIGFPESGTLYSGNNVITYTSKSINQFFGCSGVGEEIDPTDNIRSDETYYGFENGDPNKLVELRITGVLSGFNSIAQSSSIDVGEEISVKNLGEIIENPVEDSTYKEIFANSWTYNTSSRYQIDTFESGTISQVNLKSNIDKSSLKVGDIVEILSRGSEVVIASDLTVTQINDKQVTTDGTFTLNQSFEYDIRRKLLVATSSQIPLEYSNITGDVQNVYNENNEYMYVASNSLPSYEISTEIFSYNASSVSGQDVTTGYYSIINFIDKVSFYTGSEVYYKPSGTAMFGLSEGVYYVEVINDKRQIRLYRSRSFIGSDSYVQFGSLTSGTHNFTLNSQKESIISPQKVLRKFPLNVNIADGESDSTPVSFVGMMVNGVEISGYKTNEKVYYGPLESVQVLNGGTGFDVINPPLLTPSSGGALLQPVVRGSFEKIYVSPQDFDINAIVSIAVTGGNGEGATFEPVIETRKRGIEFDARQIGFGGGLDVTNETITFLKPHGLIDGQEITYNPENNSSIGIGTFGGLNIDSGLTLRKGATYFTKYISNTTIQIYQTLSDYRSGINTVGFTTVGNSGIHKFETDLKKTLTQIKVINPGSGYENRKLRVSPLGISTVNSTVQFKNHGFSDGDLISYSTAIGAGTTVPVSISGVSTSNQYYVLKVDNDTFRIANAGVAGTNTSNYLRRNYVKFGSTGSGYQVFSYPDISLSVQYSIAGVGSTQPVGQIEATPIVRGSIVDVYVYEKGSDYGSNILNLHKKPKIIVKNGKNAQLKPVIINGRIEDVTVQYSGSEYYSTPEIKVYGSGTGALIKPVIVNNKLTDAVVINPGVGYTASTTTIVVEASGKNQIFNPQVRSLTINKNLLYGKENSIRETADDILISSLNNLQYTISGYSQDIQDQFSDDGTQHSPIIGWAYDGNPIYGSYGYSDPDDENSDIKSLVSGYTLNTSNIQNRPSGFDPGFFVDDYKFTNTGDLDEYNGRYCVTPEFPNGVYAYFATSTQDIFGNVVGQFPYFIGNKYRSKFISENSSLDQTFDFNESNLIRNTLPYKVNEEFAGNDFIIESNDIINQITVVDSVTSGPVVSYEIIDEGDGYKIGDSVQFDQSNTGGSGLSAQISEVTGKQIDNINTNVTSYDDVVFTWNGGDQVKVTIDPYHTLDNLDYVTISGFSTELSPLNGFSQIGVTSYTSSLSKDIPAYSVAGVVTDIYVNRIPDNISIGSSIKIEQETLSVINIFNEDSVLRVVRETTGAAHTATTVVNYIPNTFTINKSVSYFDSKVNDTYYFNPKQSVGVGTTSGVGVSTTFVIGTRNIRTSIPTQSIYLPNHPFTTNQQVVLRKLSSSSSISVSNTSTSTPFNLPLSGDQQIVYVIKKSVDHIGIVTQIGLTTSTSGLFFRNNGTDSYQYSIQSNYPQIKGDVDSIKSTVSISTSHGLLSGDKVDLEVKPNLSVGIGTSLAIKVKYDSIRERLIINPVSFDSSGINTVTNQITIQNHTFTTGDKVVYSSTVPAVGLTTGFYYVYKVDNDNIKLCDTLIDSTNTPPLVVGITSAPAATHQISPINPSLNVVANNNVVFDLSDSSLSGYNFKIFYDNTFKDEFVSTGSTNTFSVSGVGTVGVSTTASLTINYSSGFPSKLFYNLEKSGYISTADTEVTNYSQISFVDSVYNGSYNISGVGTTTFVISLQQLPENLNYNYSDCDILKYKTTSRTASGGISKIRTISPGVNFKKIPSFVGTDSINGRGAYVVAKSESIGKINQIRIVNEGFEYPSDKTLRPAASIASLLTIKNSNTISEIEVTNNGKNYVSAPNLIIVDSETGSRIDSGLLVANLSGTSIISVDIDQEPKGLPSTPVTIRAINNTNGVGINTITSSSSGIVTCYLVTPLSGFGTEPFSVGDRIYVEGVQKYSNDGDGFNSDNYGYRFFTVVTYENGGTLLPRKLEYSLSGLSTNIGIAKTVQDASSFIVNYKDYPQFEVTQTYSPFIVGETLSVRNETGFEIQDLKVVQDNENYIKVSGDYKISAGQVVRGVQSGNIATINNVETNTGNFGIDYGSRQDIGWSDDIGKLDEDSQVIPDNDYYQNLSYSVRSNQEWVDIVSPVNSILHPIGLKNFADTTITQSVGVGSTTVSESTTILYDIIDENRVDTINNFDLVVDVDTVGSTSRFLKLKNKKLADYIECRTNRVLAIDDISAEFSSSEGDVETFANVLPIDKSDRYNLFIVQITSSDYSQIQLTELVVINDEDDVYTLEKGSISNLDTKIGDVEGYVDSSGEFNLKFTPYDPYNTDYKIKILSDNFSTFFSGIGTYSVGFVDLIGSNAIVSPGITTSLISKSVSKFETLHSQVHILNNTTNEMNYVELYVDHNGTDTNISEFYFDSNSEYSGTFIGSFGASISGGILTLNYTNTSSNDIIVRSKNIGFNTTGSGIGTYRFKKTGQIDGFERTVNYLSNFSTVSSASTVVSLDTTLFASVKSVVRVSIGQTSALHQVMMIVDDTDTYTVQYPFLSIGSTSGIGSFGGSISGSTASLIFYPDTNISGSFEILSFNEKFYTVTDEINQPNDLEYASIINSVHTANYYGLNSDNLNRLNFDLRYQGYPIFMKEFDPTDSTVLNAATGEFSIENHFFNTGEELIYRPTSTFLGVGATSVGIGSTLNSVGVVTDRLPTTVFAYKVNNDVFKLSTRKEYATAGICVTFTSLGEGNAHQLEMVKKNEKSIITLDNVVQYPISYSLINTTLNNGSPIGAATTIFALSGISSINVNDLIKIDNEYMKVNNVGLGTTTLGPISFSGSVPLVQVQRGFVGSSATSHTDASAVNVYRGSFNIAGNQIFFTNPPQGIIEDQLGPDVDNLSEARSSFNGRVFLRKDYTTNQIFDDISERFTGIGQTYTLSSQGISTVGFGTTGGNGIVFINGVFQTPTTQNNLSNNYSIVENTNLGISSIVFSGITSTNGSVIISQSDVNMNQLPRGGVIISLGSTTGVGYAPLVGASVTAIVGAGGSIVSIGIGSTGNYGSGYRNPVSIAITESGHTGTAATISAIVGAGGTLSFNIVGGGSGYVNPTINISSPNYENLPVIGVSRLGVGATTQTGVGLLLNVEVGASSTVGVGSTLFEVTGFSVTRSGYGFKKGDVITPVGLVTAFGLPSPVSQFQLTVLDTFTDSFAAWQFGELDYIDSVKDYQDGSRTRFPLFYNAQLLSFEKNSSDPDSQLIDFDSLLVIFVNGVIQEPKVAYQFTGGTSFTFTEAPKPEDDIAIFFYRGSSLDSSFRDVNETLKIGDDVQVYSNNSLLQSTTTQNTRVISNIPSSDKIQTNLYTLQGIDTVNQKPLSWTKQKVDKIIDGGIVSKARDSIEPQIYPTAKIIGNITSSDSSIYVDNAEFFNYENVSPGNINFDAIIISGAADPVSAAVTATVSVAGTISSLTINNPGSGYVGSAVTVSISAPPSIGVGIGTTATATISIVNGSLSTVSITNPGFGYTTSIVPQVLVPLPDPTYENISNVSTVQGFSGNIVGIATTVGIGTALAIRFTLDPSLSPFTNLSVNQPIYIFDTFVGNGVTSIINTNSARVGVGTTFLDNVYYINAFNASVGIITCNVQSTTSIVGIATTGSSVGKFSWGKLSGFSRSASPISIAVSAYNVDAGLSTFPTVQRRGYGLRDIGPIKKTL